MKISTFWKSLDELTDAGASRWIWRERLGSDWTAVAPFLPGSGQLAKSIPCPSPGSDGCPRQVVLHPDGTIRAICGDRPKSCRDLTLTADAVRIHALDMRALAGALVAAFALTPPARSSGPAPFMRIGSRDIQAGLGVPVFLCIPGATPRLSQADLDTLLGIRTPVLLLCPTTASLPDEIQEVLKRHGVSILGLDDALVASAPGKLRPTPHGTAQVQDLLDRLTAVAEADSGPKRIWALPNGAKWEDLTIRFTATAWITVTYGGVTRPFEPDSFGLRNTKKQETAYKEAWMFFLALAVLNGRHPVHAATAQATSKQQKHKQALSRALRDAFGIDGEPIAVEKNDYVARFVVSADGLRQGRQGQVATKIR